MKRSAFLIIGLSVLLPYLAGVLGRVTVGRSRQPTGSWARLVGCDSRASSRCRSRRASASAGAVLAGFLALSALTLATFAWHPLQRLERQPDEPDGSAKPLAANGEKAEGQRKAAKEALEPPVEDPAARCARSSGPQGGEGRRARGRQAGQASRPAKKPEPRRAPGEKELGPVWDVELLDGPAHQGIDAGEGELDALQERLEETLAEFKVEGDVAGRTTGPVVTQYGVRLRARASR